MKCAKMDAVDMRPCGFINLKNVDNQWFLKEKISSLKISTICPNL